MQKYQFRASRTKRIILLFVFNVTIQNSTRNSINKQHIFTFVSISRILETNPSFKALKRSRVWNWRKFFYLLLSRKKKNNINNIIEVEANCSLPGLETFRRVSRHFVVGYTGLAHAPPALLCRVPPWISRRTTLRTEREREREKENKPYLYLDKRYPGRCNYKLREISRNSL